MIIQQLTEQALQRLHVMNSRVSRGTPSPPAAISIRRRWTV